MTTVIEIERLSKRFASGGVGGDGIIALDDVSLSVKDGEFLALLGPSGCGKSTFLRLLGGFEQPTTGKIWMDGKDITTVPPNKRQLNMLFQTYAIFPHLNVWYNIAYGLRFGQKITASAIDEKVRSILSLVQMSEFAHRMPNQLSGGQRQRVALARALVKKPRVLLLDEPLSALDAKLRETMQAQLVNLQRNVGITFIVVTHDQSEALSMADRVAVMAAGKICQVAAPSVLYEMPTNRFVADFVGRMNVLSAQVISFEDNQCRVKIADIEQTIKVAKLPHNQHLNDCYYLGIRPEKISIQTLNNKSDQNDKNKPVTISSFDVYCQATVERLAYHGGQTHLTCRINNDVLIICTQTHNHRHLVLPDVGQSVRLSWSSQDMVALYF